MLPPFKSIVAVFGLTAAPFVALADTCQDKLASLLSRPPFDAQPYEAQITVVSSGVTSVILQKSLSPMHYLNVTTEPKGAPDILAFDGGYYSADGAGGWTLTYQMEPAELTKQMETTRAAQAANILEATCSTEFIDGKTYEVASGRVAVVPPYTSKQIFRFVIDPASGLELQSTMDISNSGTEMKTTVNYTIIPDLILPKP